MKLRKLLTYPGDLGLKFLLWRDDLAEGNILQVICHYLLIFPAIPAYFAMICADLIDDLFSFYFPPDSK